jgi:hypothetical protein
LPAGGDRLSQVLAAHRPELRETFVVGVSLLDLLAILDAALRRHRHAREQKERT